MAEHVVQPTQSSIAVVQTVVQGETRIFRNSGNTVKTRVSAVCWRKYRTFPDPVASPCKATIGVSVDNVAMLIDTGADVTILPRAPIEDLVETAVLVGRCQLEGFYGTRSLAPTVHLEPLPAGGSSKANCSLEDIHAGSSRIAKSIGPSPLPVPTMIARKNTGNTAIHAAIPPEQVKDERERSGTNGRKRHEPSQ